MFDLTHRLFHLAHHEIQFEIACSICGNCAYCEIWEPLTCEKELVALYKQTGTCTYDVTHTF